MSVRKIALCLVTVAAFGLLAPLAFAAEETPKAVPAGNGEFDGTTFTCLSYTNGLGENATNKNQAILAHLWMQGYLAGYYKAKGTLQLSDDKSDQQVLESLMLQRCRDYPGATILSVALEAIAGEPHKIPARTIVDFNLNTYTCGLHIDAHNGTAGEATKADLAEMWAFAFIQGYKNVTTPDMSIAAENKPTLIGVITKYCRGNRDLPFLNAVALVAEKVKLQ